MAQFLTTTDTSAAIERVIRNAEKELTLISAYVYPRIIYLQRLKDAAERGVNITFVFGKRRMDDKVFSLFTEIPNLRIFFLEELHAKCFVNEHEAIVTSLNLLNGSEEKNREMGVRLDSKTDASAYAECVSEVGSILKQATLIHTTPATISSPTKRTTAPQPTANESLPEKGFCIRCGTTMPCNPDAPLCYEDFTVWVRYQDPEYAEAHCHTCGTSAFVNMADPMCHGCNTKYAVALKQLTASRSKNKVFAKRTWRVEK